MKTIFLSVLIFLSGAQAVSPNVTDETWITKKQKGYSIVYKSAEEDNIAAYNKLLRKGMKSVKSFFHSAYSKSFNVYVHSDRHSLDSTWQKDWSMPSFKSECWMVASGVATRLDMISPAVWDQQACEHSYRDADKTQQVITHELVHVYHGQLNASPDFSNTEGIDWLVEGLATYASGQCDAEKIKAIKKLVADNKAPKDLDHFWTGKLKYGLSGSVVMFIDSKYGREKLKALLPFSKKAEILAALNITEADLLAGWKNYIQAL